MSFFTFHAFLEFFVFVGTSSVEFSSEVADYGYQILNEFFSWRSILLVDCDYFCPVLLEEEFEGFKAEAG